MTDDCMRIRPAVPRGRKPGSKNVRPAREAQAVVRFTRAERDAMDARCAETGATLSDFVREAVREKLGLPREP